MLLRLLLFAVLKMDVDVVVGARAAGGERRRKEEEEEEGQIRHIVREVTAWAGIEIEIPHCVAKQTSGLQRGDAVFTGEAGPMFLEIWVRGCEKKASSCTNCNNLNVVTLLEEAQEDRSKMLNRGTVLQCREETSKGEVRDDEHPCGWRGKYVQSH